jgi:hypothetical protein
VRAKNKGGVRSNGTRLEELLDLALLLLHGRHGGLHDSLDLRLVARQRKLWIAFIDII